MRTDGFISGALASDRHCAHITRVVWIIICSLCLLALAFVCSACKPAFTDEDKAAFAGYWELVSFGVEPEQKAESDTSSKEGDGEENASEDEGESKESAEPEETEEEKAAKEKQLSTFEVLLYKEWGLTSNLTLAGDGTCTFNFYGDQYQGTWKMKSSNEASVEFIVQNDEGKPQKETYSLVLSDGLLTLEIPDSPVVFKKVADEELTEEVVEESEEDEGEEESEEGEEE
ncbi:MAG: hypothetical protein Q4D34_05820 [Eggerthellaceae bacterium]|nr:hypothetical protein [Eggerthellaceae bacterium]